MTVSRAIFATLIMVTVLALPVQYVIDPSVENIACTCIVLASALTVLIYLRETTALMYHPLSSIALLGFCFSSQLGALLVQSLTGTSLVGSLYNPLYTFGTLALYLGIALLVHIAYRFFTVNPPTATPVLRGLLAWAGIYRTPSCGALWYMSCLGLPAFMFWHNDSVLGKIAVGFSFLVWAPFLIPFYSREIGAAYCNVRLNKFLLAMYSIAIAIFGLALNARGIMFAGLSTIGLLYFLAALRSDTRVSGRAVRRLTVVALFLVAIATPVSDLATAMAIARQVRGKVSAAVMIHTTLRIWRQPRVLAAYRADQLVASRFSAYDEHYIANPILARLVETKFYDNSFRFARTLTTEATRAQLREVSIRFAWAGLPSPLLRAVGINIDKNDLDFSMGDYLAYLSRGIPLGGRKTGNFFAQGIVLFGPLFPFLYALICAGLFGIMDLLTIKRTDGPASISALGMLEIWSFFMGGITYESLHKVLQYFVRTFSQTVLIYVLVFTPSRLLSQRAGYKPIVSNAAALQRSS